MSREQIKLESEVVKDHDQAKLEAEFKAAKRKQKESHLTQTHAIFEMVSELHERLKQPVISPWKMCLILSVVWVGSAALGKLYSGKWFFEERTESRRLSDENNRLSDENKMLFKKNKQHAETFQATIGLALNEPNRLETATRSNVTRPNGFPFKEWHPYFTEKFVRVAADLNNVDALTWVAGQPDWKSNLPEEVIEKVEAKLGRSLALDVYNALPLTGQQAIERLADSVRKNGVEATRKHLETQQKNHETELAQKED